MQNGGDQWEVVSLPALSETGEAVEKRSKRGDGSGSPPYEGGVDAASADGVVLSPSAGIQAESSDDHLSCEGEPPRQQKTLTPLLRKEGSRTDDDPLGRRLGAALCPERFDEKALEEIKRQLGGYAFSALYQQRPTPAEGGIFKRVWFTRFVDRAPNDLKWKRGYDLAVSTKTTSCYTSSFRVAYDASGNMYIADGFRKRLEFPDQRRYIVDRLLAEKDTEHGIEKALHGQAIIQDLRWDPAIRGTILRGVTVTADKLTRALKWAPLAEEGKVILVRGPWNQAFLDEICSFPGGQYDDQVDAVSLAVSMFEKKGSKMFSF